MCLYSKAKLAQLIWILVAQGHASAQNFIDRTLHTGVKASYVYCSESMIYRSKRGGMVLERKDAILKILARGWWSQCIKRLQERDGLVN